MSPAWWGAWPVHAETPAAGCHAEQLVKAETDADLRLVAHDQAVVGASGRMTVQVPTTWPYANDLLLSEDSDAYLHAMRCLLREQQSTQYVRADEWRMHSPQVTEESSRVKVQYDALFWFDHGGHFNVGPWAIDVRKGRWQLALAPPTALQRALWDKIQIDLGGLNAFKVSPRPSEDSNGTLVWDGLGQPRGPSQMVTVQMVPPWERAWAATSTNSEPWLVVNAAGEATWWVGTSAVVVIAALRARRQPADGQRATELEFSSGNALLRWGLVNAVMGLVILLLYKTILDTTRATIGTPRWLGYEQRWPILIGLLVGWALTASARPRRPVLLAASLVAVVGGLAVALPSLFGLPPQFVPAKSPPASAVAMLLVTAAAMLWLWLTGLILWVRLFASDGGLLRSPSHPLRLSRIGPAVTVATLLLLGWALWADERRWQRISWLSDRTAPVYHSRHLVYLSQGLTSFAYQIPTWCYSHTWVLTGFAILALLRARDFGLPVPYASPNKLDCLLLAVFFAIVVAYRQGSYAGSQVLASLWLVLDIAALTALLAVGQRWAVLAQHLEGYDAAPPLSEAITEAGRNDLIARARCYRELIATLRDLGQGRGEGPVTRPAVEKELNQLHRWRPVTGAGNTPRPWLPSKVTVVDVALSWGPYTKWWDNARRAALLAAAFGLPGSVVIVWLSYASQQQWMRTRQLFFGAPDMVWTFVSWELTFAGAGLVLGALWRLLPGRRGPSRALALVVAYTLLIILGILGSLVTDQDVDHAGFSIVIMLLVLTLTSLAMDADTFRTERRFWPSRFGLLLSIYQMRGFSAQVAWVLMQLVAVLTILKFFVGTDSRVMKP
ncbi:hypothetical protein GCM10009753_52460 [Streptantibioticus ferralitis]